VALHRRGSMPKEGERGAQAMTVRLSLLTLSPRFDCGLGEAALPV
jgi:hypothetical protein